MSFRAHPLTPKQERFVAEYLIDLSATHAAIRAGYGTKAAKQQGSRLLGIPAVAAAIRAEQDKALSNTAITATRVREEIARLAFSDIRALFSEDGNLKPLHQLKAEEAATVASVEVVIKNAQAGDGHTDTIHKIKVWDKPKSLEMLGKHFGLFQENASVSGTIELVWGGASPK